MRPDLPISLVVEYAFCPRAAWLAHVAGQFQPNEFTVEGALLHRRVHRSGRTFTSPRRFRKVPVWSQRYGIYGYADLVEEREGRLVPVEYKRGKAQVSWSDRLHVTLLALCLEEMTGSALSFGYLFYFGSRRRVEVALTPELRRSAVRTIHAARDLVSQVSPPQAQPGPRCRGCALQPACLAPVTPFSWQEWLL